MTSNSPTIKPINSLIQVFIEPLFNLNLSKLLNINTSKNYSNNKNDDHSLYIMLSKHRSLLKKKSIFMVLSSRFVFE